MPRKRNFVSCLICSKKITQKPNLKRHIKQTHKKFLYIRAEMENTTFEQSLNDTYNNHFAQNLFPNDILIESEIQLKYDSLKKDLLHQSQFFPITINKNQNNNDSHNFDSPKLPYGSDNTSVIEEDSRKCCSPQPVLEEIGATIENFKPECVSIMTDHTQTPIIPMKHREGLEISSVMKGSGKNDSSLTCEACKKIRTGSKYYLNNLKRHCLKYIKEYCCCKEKKNCCCQYSKKSVLNNKTSDELYKSFFPILSTSGKKKWFCFLCYKYSDKKTQDWHSKDFKVEESYKQDWHSIGFEANSKFRSKHLMKKHLESTTHAKSIICSYQKGKVDTKSKKSTENLNTMVENFCDNNLPNVKLFTKTGKTKSVKQCHCCDSIKKSIEFYLIMQAKIKKKIENYIEVCICSNQQFCCCMPVLEQFMTMYSSNKINSKNNGSLDTTINCVNNSTIEDNFFYYYKDYPPKKYFVCSLCNSLPEILSVWSSEGYLFTNKELLIEEMKNHLKSNEHIDTMKISKNTNTGSNEINDLLAKKRKKASEIYQHGLKNEEFNFVQTQAGLNGSNGYFKTIEEPNVNKLKSNKPTGAIELHVSSSESDKVKKKARIPANNSENEVQLQVRPESPVEFGETIFRSKPSEGRPKHFVENCESYCSTPYLARSSSSIEHQEAPPSYILTYKFSEESMNTDISSGNRKEIKSKKRKWSPEKLNHISLTNSQNEGASQILTSTANYFTEKCTDLDISLEKGNSTNNLKEKNLVLVQNFSTLTKPHNEDANSGVRDIKEEAIDIKEEPSPFRENYSTHKDKSSSINEGASQIMSSSASYFNEMLKDFDISPEKGNPTNKLKENKLILVQKFSTLTNPHNKDSNSGVTDIKEEQSLYRENDFAYKDTSSSDYTSVDLDYNYFGYGKRKCSRKSYVTDIPMPVMEKSNLLASMHNKNSNVYNHTSTGENYSKMTNENIMNEKFSKIKNNSNSSTNSDKDSQINIESSFDTISKKTGNGENLYTVKISENTGDNDSHITVENFKKIRLKSMINSFETSSTYSAICDENLNSSGELPSTEFSQRLNETEFVESGEELLEYIVKEEILFDDE